MTKSPDGALVRPGGRCAPDRHDRFHLGGPGESGDPQLQRGRVRLPGSEKRRRTTSDVHRARTQRDQRIALSRPQDHNLPFSTWSLSKLAEFLVAEGVVDDMSHDGLRVLLREEGVSFQVIKTWKQSNDPDFEAKKNPGPPPLRRRRRATYNRNDGVRLLMAAYDLNQDKPYGHIKVKKDRTAFLQFARHLRTLYPPEVRIAIVMDNFSPHLSTLVGTRVGDRAAATNVELAYVPTNASWTNRIEAQFQALRHFTLDGTDHKSHKEQNSMIRRYITWRNRNAHDKTLRELVKRANVA
jgi:hypothetical protein